MSSLTITQLASLAARREAQKARVRHLYRHALRHSLCWFGKPDFYDEATKLRERFEVHKHVADVENIERLLVQAEEEFHQKQHPDPYIVGWAPNGVMWQRNAPVPPECVIVKDFGREDWSTH